MNNIDFGSEKTKDLIAGLIALIFIFSAAYLAFSRFNNPDSDLFDLGMGGDGEVVTLDENNSDIRDLDAENENLEGWVATDYKDGDISTGAYTVKEGDTLWEIAEAVYGSGYEWTKILNDNAGDIGYLPNGQQALIVPGQVLTIS